MLLFRTTLQWEEQLCSEAEKLTDVNHFGELAVVCWPNGDIVRLRSSSTSAVAATRVGYGGDIVRLRNNIVD